jgi:hypothetical protein
MVQTGSIWSSSVVFSGRDRVQSIVIIICPLIGLASYQQAWLLAKWLPSDITLT